MHKVLSRLAEVEGNGNYIMNGNETEIDKVESWSSMMGKGNQGGERYLSVYLHQSGVKTMMYSHSLDPYTRKERHWSGAKEERDS